MTFQQKLFLGGGALTAAVLAVTALFFDYLRIDLPLTHVLQSRSPAWLDPVMRGASWFGGTFQLFGVLAVTTVVLARRGRSAHIPLPLILAVATILVPLLKELIGRPRPSGDLVEVAMTVAGKSFPSGHAFMSALILGGVFVLADKLLDSPWAVRTLRGLVVLSVLAIGASRVYLGVHWTSDVLGGFLLGLLALAAALRLFETRFLRPSAAGPSAPVETPAGTTTTA